MSAAPTDRAPEPQDRLPPIPAERMTEAQRRAAAELSSGPRGGLSGPFVPLLRSPELMSRLQKVGAYLRFESALPARLRELAILVTARFWTQQYEWHFHEPLALRAGVAPATVRALAEGRRPDGMAEEEEAVFDLCDGLHRSHAVGDRVWARAVACVGEPGVVDLVGLAGYYATLAMVMNAARTPLPAGAAPPFPPLAP